MTKRITFVIDVADPSNAAFFKSVWNIDALIAEIKAADKTVDASVFVGKLEDAPESWAYILYITESDLEQRSKAAAMKQRFPRTLLTDGRYLVAGQIAESFGMLGAMDMGSQQFGPKTPGAMFVKKDIAKALKWSASTAFEDSTFTRTSVKKPLTTLILKYLEASLAAP